MVYICYTILKEEYAMTKLDKMLDIIMQYNLNHSDYELSLIHI